MIIPLGTKTWESIKNEEDLSHSFGLISKHYFHGLPKALQEVWCSQSPHSGKVSNPLPLLLGCIHCISTWAHFVGSKKHEQARCCLSLRNIFTNKMKCMLFQRLSHNKALSVKYLLSSSSLQHRAQVSWCGTPSSLSLTPKHPLHLISHFSPLSVFYFSKTGSSEIRWTDTHCP